MKNLFFTMAMAAVCGTCNAQHTINVKLADLKSDTVTLMIVDKNLRGVEKVDTVIAKNGEFYYDFKGEKVRYALLNMKVTAGPGRLPVYLVPGEQGKLEGSVKDGAKWSGTKFYSDIAKVEELTSLDDRNTKQAKILSFIKENPNIGASVVNIMNLEDMEEGLNALSPEIRNGVFSDFVSALQARVDQDKIRKEAAKAVADGCVAPDFTLKDINGNDLALSSLRGKYLILDFWGSWCGWCIKGFPDMKKYYEKYAGKFEILGVDCNDTEEKWKAAVAKNELPWKHVYNPRTSNLAQTYAIQGYPTKIVIDAEGKIVKTIIGEDPEFYTFLDSLFGENK